MSCPRFIRLFFYCKSKKDILRTRPEKYMKIYQVLSRYCSLHDKIILDVGCSSGIITQMLSRESNITIGIDITNSFLNNLKNLKNISLLVADGQYLPFKDERVDIIISNHVIHHVRNQKMILSEFYRVLKQDGIGYIAEGYGGYNTDLRTYWRIKSMMKQFILREETINILKDPLKYSLNIPKSVQWILKAIPEFLLKLCRPFIPTWIFIAKKRDKDFTVEKTLK